MSTPQSPPGLRGSLVHDNLEAERTVVTASSLGGTSPSFHISTVTRGTEAAGVDVSAADELVKMKLLTDVYRRPPGCKATH